MKRILFAAWLALFAFQASDVLLALAPDECVIAAPGSLSDSCPDQCARCACCARVTSSVMPTPGVAMAVSSVDLVLSSPDDHHGNPDPHRILHVPKART